eukprot:Gb_22399 [translate_table: standard]
MDEAHQILLNALEHAGVVMPTGVSTIQDVGSGALVSICSQSLILINERLSFPTSLPVSMAERFRLCTDLATAIKQLGYRGDLSFHQFLYPSEEITSKLLRFMLERVSKTPLSSRGRGHRRGRSAAGGRFTGEEDDTRIATTVRSALHKWVEESNQGQGQDCAIPFRTCPLRLANARKFSKKSPALITLQAKPKTCLCPSVLEFNAKNALKAGTSTHLDVAVGETVGTKVVSHGSLQANVMPTGEYEMPSTGGYLSRSIKYSEERDWIKSLQAYRAEKEGSHSKTFDDDEENAVKNDDHKNENYIRELEENFSSLTTQASQPEAWRILSSFLNYTTFHQELSTEGIMMLSYHSDFSSLQCRQERHMERVCSYEGKHSLPIDTYTTEEEAQSSNHYRSRLSRTAFVHLLFSTAVCFLSSSNKSIHISSDSSNGFKHDRP